jgi:hypothetical protein
MQGWQFQNETDRYAEMGRTGTPIALRAPRPMFALAGAGVLYAFGLLVVLYALDEFIPIDAVAINALTVPVAIATALSALFVGPRLLRLEESRPLMVIFKITLIWTALAALWPVAHATLDAVAGRYYVTTFTDLAALAENVAGRAGFTSLIGALGGLGGGGAAVLLCTERRAGVYPARRL